MTGANHPKYFSENEIEENLKSRNSLALYRIRLLNDGETQSDVDCIGAIGFPSLFLTLLSESMSAFIEFISRSHIYDGSEQGTLLAEVAETKHLVRILTIYRRISELDPVLDEEIGKEGAHHYLSRIIKIDIYSIDCCQGRDDVVNEGNQDKIIEIQDLAGEIAASSKSFPLQASPFMREELLKRLPMVFKLNPVAQHNKCEAEYSEKGLTILINQVTERQSAQKDVGFVMWPSAVVLSRWLVSNPAELYGKTVLELGAGCGLTGLVAAKIIQDFKNKEHPLSTAKASIVPSKSGSVILSDFNEIVVQNLRGNIALNNLNEIATAEGLDFYQQDPHENGRLTIDGVKHTDLADVVLAADVICQPEDAFAAARTIASALKEGCKAIVVSADSKHRFGVEKLEEACKTVGSLSIVSKSNVDDYLNNRDPNSDSRDADMEKTSGFVDGMTLTMYIIVKNSKV